MSEEKQEAQKTVVSFVIGLLIGGLLVWAFSGPTSDAPTQKTSDDTDSKSEKMKSEENSEQVKADPEMDPVEVVAEKPVLPVGDGKISVQDQPAGSGVTLASATYPVSEGWVGVRDYSSGQLGSLLGAVRFSEEQGLVPTEIVLQRPTTTGREYAVVVYKENGDRQLNLAEDVQIDTIFSTFTAQ